MADTQAARLTAHDYMVVTPPDDFFHELIGGALYKNPSRTAAHQRVLLNLASDLYGFNKTNKLGEVIISPMDVFLSDEDVLKPDILFISKERRGIIGNWVYAAPDLVIEILEMRYPDTAQRDRTLKRERYERFGVREYWMADLEARAIETLASIDGGGFVSSGVYRAGDMLQSALLPGLRLDVGNIFQDTT